MQFLFRMLDDMIRIFSVLFLGNILRLFLMRFIRFQFTSDTAVSGTFTCMMQFLTVCMLSSPPVTISELFA